MVPWSQLDQTGALRQCPGPVASGPSPNPVQGLAPAVPRSRQPRIWVTLLTEEEKQLHFLLLSESLVTAWALMHININMNNEHCTGAF